MLNRPGVVAALLFAGLWIGFAPVQALAQGKGKGGSLAPRQNPKFLAIFREVVAKPTASTVRVLSDGKETALGVVAAADGWILTKADDLINPKTSQLKAKTLIKLKDGTEYEAQLVGLHKEHDLAMLRIDAGGLTPIQWKESKVAPVGHWVASVGLNVDPVAVGVVSVAARNVPVPKKPSQKAPPPSSGFLGVALEDSEQGPRIKDVTNKSAAQKAGLKQNDIIVSVAGKPIPDTETMIQTIRGYKPNDKVMIRVKRGDAELEVEATLGKPQANRGDIQNNMGSKLSNRRDGFPTILQHDSVVLPTDCGGPLVDLEGNVIGLNISRAGRTESYAIPAETIQAVLPDLMSGKLAPTKEKSK
jgi:serine protease Do